MSKFKSLIKRQFSYPTRRTTEEIADSNVVSQEIPKVVRSFSDQDNQPTSLPTIVESEISVDKRRTRERSRTAVLGPIEDILVCGICHGTLRSPRMMSCQHTFCLSCLRSTLVSTHTGEISITCPVCSVRMANVPPEDLPTNLYIESVLKVLEKARQERKKKAAVSFEEEDDQDESLMNCRTCKRFSPNEIRCRHCRHVFCRKCWQKHTDSLKTQLASINKELNETTNNFEQKINDFRNKISDVKELINKDIEERIAELMQERDDRISKTDEMVAPCFACVEDIKQDIKKLQNQLEDQENGAYDQLPDEQRKVRMFLNLQEKAAELVATVSVWEPEMQDLEAQFCDTKQRFEMAEIKDNPDIFYKRKAFRAKVVANSELVQRPSGLSLDPWRDHLIVACPGSGQVVVLDRKFQLLRRIYHQDMMAPQGVAYHEKTEEIFVTDKWKHCIFVFNRKGELRRRICTKGSGESQLRSPEGIAFHPTQSQLYVADTGNDRVQILLEDGTFVGSIGPTNKHGTSVMKSGRIIQVVLNQLNQPTDVVVSTASVVVADCGNNKVKIFNHEGQILRTCGGMGSPKGFFKSPQVVYIDKKENIFVGDTGNGRVQIFSPAGELLRVLGGKGSKIRQFGWVSGILVKNTHEIFVADSKNNTIQLF